MCSTRLAVGLRLGLKMFLVELVCLSVCLFVDNITQEVINGL